MKSSKENAMEIYKNSFIDKSKEKHNSKYDYSLVEYKNSKTKVKIVCPEHGIFEQRPNDHLNGSGCPKCKCDKLSNTRSLSHEQFIVRSKLCHGDKYDYSKTKYKNQNNKVTIICPTHGEFQQNPYNHMTGGGCRLCYNETTGDRCRKGKDKWIEESIEVHGEKYDYSLVEYKNNREKVKIICPDHGVFEMSPLTHIGKQKQGCKKCGISRNAINKTLTTDQFIEKSRLIHNKYDYSLVEYKNSKTKVKIICPVHGSFEQIPSDHTRGNGCPYCYIDNSRGDSNSFIKKSKKIHGDKYDYSLVEYKNNKTKVKIICSDHGIFEQYPNHHLKGHGCRLCSNKLKSKDRILNKKEFIQKSNKHHSKYDYSLVEYKNSRIKVKIICSEHGVFEQRPNDHLSGQGCPKCSMGGTSYKEKELSDFIKETYDGEIIENSRSIISPLELDIYLPELRLAFEFNGLYWHNELYVDKNYHLNKTKLCEEKGIHLVHIYEDDWVFKNDIVKSRILNLLGKTQRKIYARQCEIKEVSSKESKEFLIENHIQGNVNSKVKLGLYYKEELVSLMTFGNLRKNLGSSSKENSYELLRFCNKINTNVIGGANKLYKFFVMMLNPKEILSYADRSWTSKTKESLYDKLGFTLLGESRSNYHYIVEGKRKNRFNYRKDILVKEGFDLGKTERDIMFDRGIYRIYNCGSLKYINTIVNLKC